MIDLMLTSPAVKDRKNSHLKQIREIGPFGKSSSDLVIVHVPIMSQLSA